jgi:hypothetical protein
MANIVGPIGIVAAAAIAAAFTSGCSTYNQTAAAGGVPCLYDTPTPPPPALTGNVGGAIGGRMVLGATPADNKPLCYAR